jgi:hypothetical protein
MTIQQQIVEISRVSTRLAKNINTIKEMAEEKKIDLEVEGYHSVSYWTSVIEGYIESLERTIRVDGIRSSSK